MSIKNLFFLIANVVLMVYFQATNFAAETSSLPNKDIPTLLVSVAPHKFFVEKIAGETVKVELMVPAGASSHTFEPSPKQMLNAGRAEIWFQIGEGFEPKATAALKSHHPKMTFIDLRLNLDLIYDSACGKGHCHHCTHHVHADCSDPHFWLSARQAKIQAKTIADALSKQYPNNSELYKERLKAFSQELDTLDQEITKQLSSLKNRTIMVSHPAYAYYVRDYNLNQLSIEFEGKDPSPKQLTTTLSNARKADIKTIFIQPQYNNKGARLIAKEINAKVVTIDPYAENYLETMREITTQFASK